MRKMVEEAQYVAYVKGSKDDNWHWCKNCPQYPLYVYQRLFQKPRTKLCPVCWAKEHNGNCETDKCVTEERNEPHLDQII